MTTAETLDIYLVRHGEAAAGWHQATDPGLSELGQQQAQTVAEKLSDRVAEAPKAIELISSPLARTQETAAPLAAHWHKPVALEPRIAEIPSPSLSMEDRGPWLHEILRSQWSQVPELIQQWRAEILKSLYELKSNSVFFTHFVVINAVVSHLTGSDDLVSFHPDNGSITHLQLRDGKLTLISLGQEADTRIN